LIKAIQSFVYYYDLLNELGFPVPTPGIFYVDNQALIDTLSNDSVLPGSRHFLQRINYCKQMKNIGLVEFKKIKGEFNPSDLLTKQLNREETKAKTKLLMYDMFMTQKKL
jgi:hypothetical protein